MRSPLNLRASGFQGKWMTISVLTSWPVGSMLKEIGNGGGEIVVRVQQARRPCDDAVTIRVGVIAERQVKAVTQLDRR